MVKNRLIPLSLNLLTLGVLSLLLFSGCQQAVESTARFTSKEGVKVEAFMPGDSFLLLKVGTRDADQLAGLKTLNAYFPNDPMGMIVSEFNQGFKKGANLDEIGLDYEKDIVPILSDKSEMYLALAPSREIDPGAAGKQSIGAVVAMTVADTGKFDNLIQKQLDKGKLIKNDYNGQTYYSQEGVGYLVRYKDVVFVSTSLDFVKNGLDSLKNGKDLLAENANYMQAMDAYYKPSLAFAYGDFARVMDFLAQTSANGEDVAKTLSTFNPGTVAKDIQSEVITLVAGNDGLRLTANIVGREGSDFSKTMGGIERVYLADKIPGKDAVVYTEGSNLRKTYDQFIELGRTDAAFGENFKQMQDYLTAQGLDLEKDVLTFMSKGFALALSDTGAVIPSLGVYLDASGNVDGAAKVVTKINSALDGVFLQAKMDSPELEILVRKEEVDPGKLWKYVINLDPILTQVPQVLSQKLSGQKIEFYYGLLADNTMVFAFNADLEKSFGKDQPVSQGKEYHKAMGYLSGADRAIGYLAPAQLVTYFDRLVDVAKMVGMDSELLAYDLIRSYVLPLQSFSFGTVLIDKTHLRSEAFLHIGK